MPSTLVSLADVKRVLRLTDDNATRDAQLRGALAAIESWAEDKDWLISKDGSQVETYFDVYEDATLRLPAADVTVTKVKVYEYPSSSGIPLSPIALGLGHGYDVTGDGSLILRPLLGVSPLEGAIAQRRLRTYSRVEVYFSGTGVVPVAISEGLANLAAGYWKTGDGIFQQIQEEKIGDYSYKLSDANAVDPNTGEPLWVVRAMFFLRPKQRQARVSVT